MKKKIIILSFSLILLIAIVSSLKLWINMDFINISTNGIVAISICIIVSLLLALD